MEFRFEMYQVHDKPPDLELGVKFKTGYSD